MTVYCFDIDGTICTNTDGDYEHAMPSKEIIEKINCLYDSGREIVFYIGGEGLPASLIGMT